MSEKFNPESMAGWHPQKKSAEELHQQVEVAEEGLEETLSPESKTSDMFGLSEQEIKQKYPRRYAIYQQLVREQILARHGRESELKSEDLDTMRNWLHMLNGLDRYISHHPSPEHYDPRGQRQFSVLEDVRRFMEGTLPSSTSEEETQTSAIGTDSTTAEELLRPDLRGYVKLPTGVGKTALFVKITEALGVKTLIVVPTQHLVDQTVEGIKKFTSLEHGKYFAGEKDLTKQATVITYASFLNGVRTGIIQPADYGFLVLDEAHNSLTKNQMETVDKFTQAVKIGFTATPDYSEEKALSNLLPQEIHSLEVREAIEEGLLSGVRVIVAETETDLSNVSIDRGEYKEGELEKAVNIQARNQAAVEMYLKMFDGEKAVFFCAGVAHAQEIARMLSEKQVKAEAVWGERKDKREIIDRHKLPTSDPSHVSVLCNADLLTTGYDNESVSVCMNLKPSRSPVDVPQRAGRVLRLDPNNPNKFATVVEFLDQNSLRPQLLYSEFLEGSEVLPVMSSHAQTRGNDNSVEELLPRPLPKVPIVGLTVHFTVDEVMAITRRLNEEWEKEKTEFLPFDILQEEVRREGIKSRADYSDQYKAHPGWPSHPSQLYKSHWPKPGGWDVFLGKIEIPKAKILSFVDFQAEVRKAEIKSSIDYRDRYKTHPGWPSNPNDFYDQWPKGKDAWNIFLGKEKIEFLPFGKLQEEVRKAGIKSSGDYKDRYKTHPGWPSDPLNFYAEWPKEDAWNIFLGKEKIELLSFEDLQADVRKEGIKSKSDYKDRYKTHPGWPSNPNDFYDRWPKKDGWDIFLGKEKIELLSFEDLQEEVRREGIKSSRDYRDRYKTHPGWPSNPNDFYDRWPKKDGWDIFLGKKKEE